MQIVCCVGGGRTDALLSMPCRAGGGGGCWWVVNYDAVVGCGGLCGCVVCCMHGKQCVWETGCLGDRVCAFVCVCVRAYVCVYVKCMCVALCCDWSDVIEPCSICSRVAGW